MVNGGHNHSYMHLLCSNFNLPALLAEACEKLGLHDQALSYAEQAATNKDIVVSVDDMGVSKTPGLRVNAPPSADRCNAGSRRSCFSNRILSSFQFS